MGDGIAGTQETSPRRFILSAEKFATDRIAVLKQEIANLKTSHPEVLSFCVFGSMVSGKARQESDIDGYLFVDVGEASKNKHVGIEKVYQTEFDQHGGPSCYLREEIEKQYLLPLRTNLKDRLGLTDEQVKHVRTRAISEEIINLGVAHLLGQIRDLNTYQSLQNERDSIDTTNATLRELDHYWESAPKHPGLPRATLNLSAMFHLDIGGGIGKYRDYLIGRLSQLGNEGEQTWRFIIEGTEEMEQHFATNTAVNYPRTLEQAKKVYCQK